MSHINKTVFHRSTDRLCAGSGFMEQTQSSGNTLPTVFAANGKMRHFRHRSSMHHISKHSLMLKPHVQQTRYCKQFWFRTDH